MTNVLPMNDAPTRTELEIELGHMVYAAKRQVPAVGNDRLATPWDLAHLAIDAALTRWEMAR